MPSVISIIGRSNSGKTTFIEKLVSELKSRGYRLATIKHAPQGMTVDESDKDSSRHLKAGSEAVIVSSPDKILLIKKVTDEVPLEQLISLFGEDYDLVIAEGFKQSEIPKIEVHRKEIGPPLTDIKRLIAIVTDETLDTQARQYSFDEIKKLSDLIEQGFIKPQKERLSLYVNDVPIQLGHFPREFVANILVAMASSLKGVGDIKDIKVFLKKEV